MSVTSATTGPKLVDTLAAAEILDVSTRTIWTLEKSGELKAVRIGRAVRFSIADLERFIAEKQGGEA